MTRPKPTLDDLPKGMIRTEGDERLWAKLSEHDRERLAEDAEYVLDEYGPDLRLIDIHGILRFGG